MPREWLVRIEGGSSEQSPARGAIPKFYPIAQRGCGATETDSKARRFHFRAAAREEVMPPPAANPQGGSRTTAHPWAIRVKVPSGSANAVRRRELVFGNEEDRVDDNARRRVEKKTRCEKLNDERPIKGLPVRTRRDAPKREKVYAEG